VKYSAPAPQDWSDAQPHAMWAEARAAGAAVPAAPSSFDARDAVVITQFAAADAVVRDAAVTSTGYQGLPAPNQWFGGPALSPAAGTMVLRDATGLVVDSLNYGLLVDPWAAEGYHMASGTGESGCRVTVPVVGRGGGRGGAPAVPTAHRSAGRFPDGADTDSNCNDFLLQPAPATGTGTDLPTPGKPNAYSRR